MKFKIAALVCFLLLHDTTHGQQELELDLDDSSMDLFDDEMDMDDEMLIDDAVEIDDTGLDDGTEDRPK
jgi:hypothetical protein